MVGHELLVVIDIGNTNTVCGIFEGERLGHTRRFETKECSTSTACCELLQDFLSLTGHRPDDVHGVAITSVVPAVLAAFHDACRQCIRKEPFVVSADIDCGIYISYMTPLTLGADRIVNAAAAFAKYHRAVLVVDAGTATTFDYVSAQGRYEGGAIAPGIAMMRDGLSQGTAQLPSVTLEWNGTVLGKNTVESLQSGIVAGYICLVEGMITMFKNHIAQPLYVIATGGRSVFVAQHSRMLDSLEPDLTLEGLKFLFERNKKH